MLYDSFMPASKSEIEQERPLLKAQDDNDKIWAWNIMVIFHNWCFSWVLVSFVPHMLLPASFFFETFFVWTVRVSLFGPYFVYWFITALMVKGSYFNDSLDARALSITF